MKMITDLMMTSLITSLIYVLGHSNIHPHLAGFAMLVFMYAIEQLPDRVAFCHKLDAAMLDAQKIETFISSTPQMEPEHPKPTLPDTWPTQGLIEFDHVTIGYKYVMVYFLIF